MISENDRIIDINYPDAEISRMTGKYFPEVATLFVGGYINSNREPVQLLQSQYIDWVSKQILGVSYIERLAQIVKDGGIVTNLFVLIKISKLDFNLQTYPGSELTWKQWSESRPQGAKFTNLMIKQDSTHVWLRPNHYTSVITSDELATYSNLVYLQFVDEY